MEWYHIKMVISPESGAVNFLSGNYDIDAYAS
jgi:hypothetical protein